MFIKLHESIKKEDLDQKIRDMLISNTKNRIIFDVTDAKVTMSGMKELKSVFTEMDKETRELIMEICIIVKGTFTREIVSTFIKATRQKIKTRIL